jgi:hypothetical protein
MNRTRKMKIVTTAAKAKMGDRARTGPAPERNPHKTGMSKRFARWRAEHRQKGSSPHGLTLSRSMIREEFAPA